MWNFIRHLPWAQILAFLSTLIVISTVLKNVFGVEMFGKKIFKGAPLLWKWMMRAAIHRNEVRSKLNAIMNEVSYNGGSSLKDAVRRMENTMSMQTETLKYLKNISDIHSLRLDISDVSNKQMTFRFDSKGGLVFINEAFLKLFGYTESEMVGFNWESIVHEEDLEEVQVKWKRSIEMRSRYFNEHRVWDQKGEIHQIRVIGYPIVNDGILEGFYGTVDLIIHN